MNNNYNTNDNLLNLLKVPSFESIDEFHNYFENIAYNLLNNYILFINNDEYILSELEFYWRGKNHDDVFVHCNSDQKKFGTWYFHKFGNNYKNGTYKGLDIVFGNDEYYGGILIRSITNIKSSQFIEGPCLCVDHILSKNNVKNIEELVKKINISKSQIDNNNNNNPIYLKYLSNLPKKNIYKSPRVGLTLKNKINIDMRKLFIMKPLRYFTIPSLKKGKNYIILQLYHNGLSIADISAVSKSSEITINKCIEEFNNGKKTNIESFIGIPLKPNDICRLMGNCYSQI